MGVINSPATEDKSILLWNKFRKGDKEAFARLAALHYQPLFNYGSRFTTDFDFLKDCIQELFLSLWKNRLTVGETSFVKYYLFKSLRRKLKQEADKNKKAAIRAFSFFQSCEEAIVPVEHTLMLEEAQAEQVKLVRQLVARLSKRQQEVIYLRFYGDIEIEEIAEIMHLNRQSVYNLLHDALKELRRISIHTNYLQLQHCLMILLPSLPEFFLKISEKIQ
ncbi:MAG TPA: sigma-70 family RNA polymerase sigma factor [Chitinophagaceae bacterium]|nr:sigma-70 family RNA polymerase sigma factor [Chitinophagaceae bacterium]